MDEMMEVDHLECDICGERTFQERAGFYFCIECGTKKEQLAMAVEISAEDTFNDTSKHVSSHTVKKPKAKSNENDTDITSWEFYNYVLRGFLQELLNMGAKPELKIMTLQVWAAYLGRMEVAFCKDNELDLPKLNVRVLPRDARIIYNHKKAKRKRSRQQKKASSTDVRASWRHWRKTKRKLDASGYSKGNAPSESTLHSTQSIRLQWSRNARKSLKCQMPLKHLDRHSLDSSGSMQCHGLRPKAKTLSHFDRNIYCLNVTKLYIILGIALNMVEDDIQLTDLLRFIDEEHLTGRNILSYLPEHISAHGKTLLKDIEFAQQMDKCRYKFIRMNIAQMSRFIDLDGFQMPNLAALAERYVLELSLPPLVASYVTSLMNFLPPAFEPNFGLQTYPRYEARVMAYIIYVLKLLFGLDDVKERDISKSAQSINDHLIQASTGSIDPNNLLFVYTEWMQFVELRKNLVSHYNESFAQRFGVGTQLGRQVDDFINKESKQKEQEYNFNDLTLTPALQRKQENLTLIFESLLSQLYGESSTESAAKDHIEFQPTLTPAHSYFKRLLLYASRVEESERMSVKIPNYMYIEHYERQLAPFKNQTTELAQKLTSQGINLRVEELACQQNYQNVGIFQTLHNKRCKPDESRANCDITMEQWLKELSKKEKRPSFQFRQPIAKYTAQYQNTMQERALRREKLESKNPFSKMQPTPTYLLNIANQQISLNDLTSIQTFEETNMDPLKVPLERPRRHLERLEMESDEPSELPVTLKVEKDCEENETIKPEMVLKISNFDCWLLHGYMSKIRESDKRELRVLFPCSFRWLLDICAGTIGVPWDILYEQLLVVEVMFHRCIEDLNNYNTHLRLKNNLINKDFNLLTKTFRDMW